MSRRAWVGLLTRHPDSCAKRDSVLGLRENSAATGGTTPYHMGDPYAQDDNSDEDGAFGEAPRS